MKTLSQNLVVQMMLGLTLIVAVLAYSPDSEAARRRRSGPVCDRGMLGANCVSSMGNPAGEYCQMDPLLLSLIDFSTQKTKLGGHRVNSCCRTNTYQANLRACGYPAARVSNHVSGRAVDLAISPKNCNQNFLLGVGMPKMCPLYHFNHCHVALCGDQASYNQARERQRQRDEEIRRRIENGQGPVAPPVTPNNVTRPNVQTPKVPAPQTNTAPRSNGFVFDSSVWLTGGVR
jgi:hypothetical protein